LEVRRVFDAGLSTHGRRMVLFVAPGSDELAVVAARRVGGAVERNRARRIVAREAIRGAKTQDLVADMIELLPAAGLVRP
jgi:ribonuclease P protein component